MAARKAEFIFVGDAKSVVRAAQQSSSATAKAGKQVEGVHVRMRKSFAGLTASAAKMGGGIVAAYASIEGAKKAIDATDELAKSTIGLHKNFGLTIKTASEWAAVAKTRGVDGKQLTMGFKTLASASTAAAAGGKAQVASFKALGISTQDLKKHGGNLNDMLHLVSDGLGKLPAGTNKAALMSKLFGRSWQGIAPLLRGGSKAMDEQLKVAEKYGATFGGKSIKSVEDMVAAQREAKLASMGLQVTLGTTLIPALTKGFGAFATFAQKVRSGGGGFAKFRQDVRDAVAEVKTDFAALIAVAGPIVQRLITLFQGLPRPVKIAVAAIAGLGIVMAATSPLGVAIVALAGAAILIKRNWGPITALFDKIKAAVSQWAAKNRADINVVIKAVKDVAAVVRTVLGAAFNYALAVVKRAMPGIKSMVTGTIQVIRGVINVFLGLLHGDWSRVWGGLKGIASGAIKLVAGAIRAGTANIREAAARVGGAVVKVLHDLGARMLQLGVNLIKSLANGIANGAKAAVDAVGNAGNAVVDKAKKVFHIGSPSKVFTQIGMWISQGLADGIAGGAGMVNAAVKSGLLYPIDAAIAALQAQQEKLQGSFDKWDQRRQRADLVAAIGTARTDAASSAASGSVDSGLGWARSMVGHFKESTGKNTGPELDKLQQDFGTHAAAWCAEFATTAIIKAGAPKEIKSASVAQLRAWAQSNTHGLGGVSKSGKAGDLFALGNSHVGVVESVDRKKGIVHTIEGNTGGTGGVKRNTRAIGSGDFLNVKYPGGGGGKTKSTLSIDEVRGVAYAAGFRGKALDTAVAIAMAESGGKTGASHKNTNGTTDRGLFQINSVHGAASTFDVGKNAKAAYALYKKRGGFGDWATFNSGAYKSHLGNVGSGTGAAMSAAMSASGGGGSGGSVADAIKALKDFDREAARAKKLAAIDVKVKGLEALKAYKDAVTEIKGSLGDLADQGAQAFRTIREAAIDADTAGRHAAVEGSLVAGELSDLQKQDAADDKAKALADAQKAVEDAQFLVGHSGGQTHLDALQQLKDAQDAQARVLRGYREQDLQDWKDTENAKIDASATTQKDGLDAEQAAYRDSLQGQFDSLLGNLTARKITYAQFFKDVNNLAASFGGVFAGSADQQAAIVATTPPAQHLGLGGHLKMPRRAKGGPVSSRRPYIVGENGPEMFVPGSNGTIIPNGGGRGGGNVFIQTAHIGSKTSARILANTIAHKLAH